MSDVENVFAPPRSNVAVAEGPPELWQMPFKQLRRLYLASVNIRALGMIYCIVAVCVGALFLMVVLGSYSRSALSVILFTVVLAATAACVTSYTRQEWGLVLGGFLCFLALFLFPVGTVIGIMGLIAYYQGARLFGPGRLRHEDLALVYKQRKDEN